MQHHFDPHVESGFNLPHKLDMPTGLRVALGSNMIFLNIHFILKFKFNALIMLSTKTHPNFEFRPEASLPLGDVKKFQLRTECSTT